MTNGTATTPSQQEDRTIILPIRQDEYEKIVSVFQKFRAWLDQQFRLHPELFPETFEKGYKLHDMNTSSKIGVVTRRIKLRNGQVWTVYPSFVMPHMTGYTEEVAKALYLRKFGVPYEALTYVFGNQEKYFVRGQHFHGTLESANLRSRSWAILHNYWDWGRRTRLENGGARCPAERLNGRRYADNWLENLLVAMSAVPKTKPPLKTA